MFNALVTQSMTTKHGKEPDNPSREVSIVRKRKKVTPLALLRKRRNGEKITMVSAYDYPTACWADKAWVDIVFVSDALATVGLGRESVLSVTVDEIVYHTKAVKNGSGNCLVLAAMPFQSYSSRDRGIENAARIVMEGGAHAVEIEGDRRVAGIVAGIVQSGIPVVAHIGLTKSIASRTGHYQVQGKNADSALSLVEDAIAFEEAGATALVIECVPRELARIITSRVSIPTISIGSGPDCSGQGLVTQDMLGIFDEFCPSFVKRYGSFSIEAVNALKKFVNEVDQGMFPSQPHSKSLDPAVMNELLQEVGRSSIAAE